VIYGEFGWTQLAIRNINLLGPGWVYFTHYRLFRLSLPALMQRRTCCARSLRWVQRLLLPYMASDSRGSTTRSHRQSRAFWWFLDRAGAAESGLWEIREVALVSSSPAPEVCPAEHAL